MYVCMVVISSERDRSVITAKDLQMQMDDLDLPYVCTLLVMLFSDRDGKEGLC